MSENTGTDNTQGNVSEQSDAAKATPSVIAGKSTTPKTAPKAKGTTAGKPKSQRTAPASQPETVSELQANQVKQVVGDALIDAAAELSKSWNPAQHNGVSKEQAFNLLGSYCSFTPGSYWRPELATPQTGRGHKHRLDGKGREMQRKFLAAIRDRAGRRGRRAA